MSVLTFTEYIPPTQTAAGKWPPSKAKASDGKVYALPKDAVELIKNSLGTPLEVVTESKQNGKFWNHSVLSAKHIVATAGPESPQPQTPTTQEGPVPTSPAPAWQNTDAARQRLIVRQSSLRAAIDWMNGATNTTSMSVTDLAEQFTRWVFEEEETRGLNGGSGDTKGVPASETKTPPRASSPAQEQLEVLRNASAAIRSGYHPEDAVCPKCGRKEFLGPRAAFCARKNGGCGWPSGDDEREAISYGEWVERQAAVNLRRPDAPVVSPTLTPSRSR